MGESIKKTELQITVKNLGLCSVEADSTAVELINDLKERLPYQVVALAVDNDLKDLSYVFTKSCSVELLDLSTEIGFRIYRRGVVFLLLKACRELYPETQLLIKHSLSNGLYCELLDKILDDREVAQIQKRMRELAVLDLPIKKMLVSREQAAFIYEKQGMMDKIKLLQFREKKLVHMYELDGFYEYFYGHMVPNTGMLDNFRLLNYAPGLILQTPERNSPNAIQPFIDQRKIFSIYSEAKEWGEMMGTPHVAALNDIIENQDIVDLIRINEALHEKKIASIADIICQNKKIRLILIAGPSSSGKTTFAQRLMIQLRVNGLKPVMVSLDDYFVNREDTPRDENGEWDFEALEALKLDLFNEQLSKMIKGEEVQVPIFNFKKGRCEDYGVSMRVPNGEPIIVEGIHGLNDQLTWSIPAEQKFKIYISALTQLNIDFSNRIPTTDCRLLRRIIRDARTRGHGTRETLNRWPSVRRGEMKNIFPFQENADVMFNSSLVYELAVLKKYAEPLLMDIGPGEPEYIEAKRLSKFLSYFREAPADPIPPNSILREFVGGSWFHY
ncbi:uridine kinase [hydrocarbon metagenome]|uniref:Uridine kinase n=1 Tax=hydrocarbon metagenome TaxID=938273 RepID=A0A0W8E8N4_9ZZZZ